MTRPDASPTYDSLVPGLFVLKPSPGAVILGVRTQVPYPASAEVRRVIPTDSWTQAAGDARLLPVAFHDNFWVTVGAAAPVIALTSLLSTTDNLRLVDSLQTRAEHAEQPGPKFAYYHPAIALTWATTTGTGLVLLGQATALVVALMSLDFGRNVFSPEFVVEIMGASFVVLFLSGGINVLTRGVEHQFIERMKSQEKEPTSSSDHCPPSAHPATSEDDPS